MKAGQLVIGTWPAEQGFELPAASLAAEESLDITAKNLITPAKDNNRLKPLVGQTRLEKSAEGRALRLGYAAVMPLESLYDKGLLAISLERLQEQNLKGLDAYSQKLVRQSYNMVQGKVEISLPTKLYPDCLPILARLVEDPRSFTAHELYNAIAALKRPGQVALFDRTNITRWMKHTAIQPTDNKRVDIGRPARLFTMPANIL